MGIGDTVGADETVVAEIGITGIVSVEVSSISVDAYAAFAFPSYRLVHEIPDESALKLVVFAVSSS